MRCPSPQRRDVGLLHVRASLAESPTAMSSDTPSHCRRDRLRG
ncbi:hypothetical protein TN51_13170 [Xanthomonas euvesicatoria pv. citrumelonis]|nr:hypothetical protein TN51_13170 [Xanthomonas euvesicatoria pv. citrumelonis]